MRRGHLNMSSSSSEIDPVYEPEILRKAKQDLWILMLWNDIDQIEKDLQKHETALLRAAGYELYDSRVDAAWDLRDRKVALHALNTFNNLDNEKYPRIASALEGIHQAQDELKNSDLADNVFGDNDELDELKRNLWLAFDGSAGTTPENRLTKDIMQTVNDIVDHANRHLSSTYNSSRAQEGREKYAALVELFQEIKNTDDPNPIDRLGNIRTLIRTELNKDPNQSDLLKNRGGFFGAYKTVSKLLDKFGKEHYRYNDRTSISSLDHLMMIFEAKVNARLQHELQKNHIQDDVHNPNVIDI